MPAAKVLKNVELSIVLTNNLGIKKINKKWRGKNQPTDVLSFPMYLPEELKLLPKKNLKLWQLGDVILNVELARTQAKLHGWSYYKEIERLLVHGIVHLLGYDHELGKKEARRMHSLEKYLLEE